MIDVQITLGFLALFATIFVGIATASTTPIVVKRAAWLFVTAITISGVYVLLQLALQSRRIASNESNGAPFATPAQSIFPPNSPHPATTSSLQPALTTNQTPALSRSSSVATNPDLKSGYIMGDLIWTLVIGLIVGVVAKLLMPGRDPGGCILTILIGIAGSFFASHFGQVIGWYEGGQPASFIGSVVGAMLLLLIYRLVFGRPA